MCVTHGEKNVCSRNLFQQARICTVATDSKSSDTVWFVRLRSNHEEAMTYITDDYGHNIVRVQTYISGSYYEKKKNKQKFTGLLANEQSSISVQRQHRVSIHQFSGMP